MTTHDIVANYGRTMPPDGKPAYFRLHRFRFQKLLAALPPPPARVLEVGTTPGQFTEILRRAGYDVAGVDLFPEQRAALWQRLGVEVRFCNIDEQPLPYGDAEFDAVVFSEVIEHLVSAPLPALREMARVLRPGGRLIITTPNQHYIKSRLKTLFDVLLGRPFESFAEFERAMRLAGPQRYYNHSRLYTLEELRWLVEQSGLQVAFARPANAWEQVGVEPLRALRHPLRVGVKAGLWLLTSAFPQWRSMLLVIGQKTPVANQ
ncbi:MAG TPA: class I SAM-dependent methyltransferase [Kouleothrix sp.]|jgi:SAM-dependent methyltransferase|nr:class I SAM-dependent methyltransferase [Kouleothrix sp.]